MPHALTDGAAATTETLVAALWRTVSRNGEQVTMPRRLGCILGLALHGLRLAEITQARHDQLALPAATLYVRSVKRGRPRLLQLDPDFAASLSTCRHISRLPTPFLVPTGTGHRINTKTAGRMCRRWLANNIGPYSAHSLRHTAAVRCYKATGDVLAVMHLLGHRTLAHTLLYLQTWQPNADPGPSWPPRYDRPPLRVRSDDVQRDARQGTTTPARPDLRQALLTSRYRKPLST